jgi:starch phosphorylase
LALFEDVHRLKSLLENSSRPVRVIVSGKLHPSDSEGAAVAEHIMALCETELKDLVVFLPQYDMTVAKLLVSGTDVWLNTPIVGFEACGTSGMKAALNSSLPVSTKDGWVAEVDLFKKGWAIENDPINKNLLDTLEQKVVPTFFENREDWKEMMRASREMILKDFSAKRMLQDYSEKLYS